MASARSGSVAPAGGGGGGATGGGGGAGAGSPATVKDVVAVWTLVSIVCASLFIFVFSATTEKVYALAVTRYVIAPSVVLLPHVETCSPRKHVKSAVSLAE